MTIKSYAAAALLALSTFTPAAHAEKIWTFTVSGTIESGWDGFNLFGGPNDLTGLAFTETITASLDPAQWEYDSRTDTEIIRSYASTSAKLDGQITINGKTVSLTTLANSSWYPSSPYYSGQYIRNGASSGDQDILQSSVSLFNHDLNLVAYVGAQSDTPFLSGLDFSQTIAHPDSAIQANAFFRYGITYYGPDGTGGEMITSFTSGSDATFTTSVSAVPEPATYGMLLAGLGLVGLMAARRKA